MKPHPRPAMWLGAVLGTACALFLFAVGAYASDNDRAYTEEFHQTYALTPDGSVDLSNINGNVHISTWDRNEVKVDAVKYADEKEELEEAHIEVNSGKDYLSIRTKYPDHDNWEHHRAASVEYTLTVPRTARLDKISLVNGSLDVTGVSGEVRASLVNGRVEASNLAGRTKISTVNGRLEARFDQLPKDSVELESVNGGVRLTIPSDSNAELEATTVSGGIDNDFGLHVNHHHYIGHDMRGELGNGGTRIHVSDVNGTVDIRHADDGRPLSPVKDRNNRDRDDDE